MALRTLLLLFLFLAPCLNAQKVRDFDIGTTEKLGQMIFEHDALAWKATDVLFAKKPDLSQHSLAGYLAKGTLKNGSVTFIGQHEEGYRAVFSVTFKKGKPVFSELDKEELTPRQLAEFTARQTAIAALDKPCSELYNTVVLPDVDGDGFLVYLLPGTKDPTVVPVGGAYRITVPEDGKSIELKERLSTSCLTITKEESEGRELAALTMSHIVSKQPTEVHVFLSTLNKLPFYVYTPETGAMWEIEKGRLQVVN